MKKIVFDHIPKTAGTTVHDLLKEFVGSNKISSQAMGEPIGLYLKHNGQYDVISGHFRPHSGVLSNTFFWITILRDPLDRILSEYYFLRETVLLSSGKMPHHLALANKLDLEDYLDCQELYGTTQNAQAKHFAAYVTTDTALNDEDLYQAACIALDQFDLVGATDKLHEFILCLCWERNWKLPEILPRRMVTSKRMAVKDLSGSLRTRMEQANAVDQRLLLNIRSQLVKKKWDICSSLFSARLCHFNCFESDQKIDIPISKCNAPLLHDQSTVDFGNRDIEIVSGTIHGSISLGNAFLSGELIDLSITLYSHINLPNLNIMFSVYRNDEHLVFRTNSRHLGYNVSVSADRPLTATFRLRADFAPANYYIGCALYPGIGHMVQPYHWKEKVIEFSVIGIIGAHFDGCTRLYPVFFIDRDCCEKDNGVVVEQVESEAYIVIDKSIIVRNFDAEILILSKPATLKCDSVIGLPVQIKNLSEAKWPSIGNNKVCLSYHWNKPSGDSIIFDGLRTHLPYSLQSGDKAKIDCTIQTPSSPGSYQLIITLVQEGVAWFEEKGFIPPVVEIEVAKG